MLKRIGLFVAVFFLGVCTGIVGSGDSEIERERRGCHTMNVQPNKLRVGGIRFRVKRSPFSAGGAFVYDPRTTFHGVARSLVWWVPSYEAAKKNRAYPLNSPSKMVTPELEFPLRGEPV